MHTLLESTQALPVLLEIDWWHELGKPVVITIVLGTFAVALMMAALWLLDRTTPFSINRQLEEKQNMAVAVVVAAVVVGIALVVASVARG